MTFKADSCSFSSMKLRKFIFGLLILTIAVCAAPAYGGEGQANGQTQAVLVIKAQVKERRVLSPREFPREGEKWEQLLKENPLKNHNLSAVESRAPPA